MPRKNPKANVRVVISSRTSLSPHSKSPVSYNNNDTEDGIIRWIEKMRECPVYRPSKEEFEDPLLYIQKIAPEASKYGICKVVPPLFSLNSAGIVLKNENKGFKFTTKVQPLRVAEWKEDDKGTFFMRGRTYTIRDFENMANKEAARRHHVSGCLPASYVENEFWNEMDSQKKKGFVEYGINVDGSCFSSSPDDPLSTSKWNLKKLPQHPMCSLRLLERDIPGVSEPMLYIGMLFSMFAWHVEDLYLYSINYHHCGAPKTWYGVPSDSAFEFEKTVRKYIYKEILTFDDEDSTFDILSNKTTMFSPKIMLQNDVPVYRTVQLPGEFVITFPQSYHAGFSHGFNIGEAVNFSTKDWFHFGKTATERYAKLERTPIIPYEELICKEALLLASSSLDRDSYASLLKVSFVCLVRSHHFARWSLAKTRKPTRRAIKSRESDIFFCVRCKRECYIAYVACRCRPEPRCVFHEMETYKCGCGRSCKIYVRDDVSELESVAKRFDEDQEVLRKVREDQFLLNISSSLACDSSDYIPYSED